MVEYDYYVVESSCVVRVGPGTTEQLMRDGSWADYPDRWEVLSGGRRLENEEKALAKAGQLFEHNDARDAGRGDQGMSLVRVRCRRAIPTARPGKQCQEYIPEISG